MADFKWTMSRCLFLTLLTAVLCVLVGEFFYLMRDGFLPMGILLSPSHVGGVNLWIQTGLFLLVFFQLLRVFFAGLFFVRMRDRLFAVVSAFVLLMLIYGIFFEK